MSTHSDTCHRHPHCFRHTVACNCLILLCFSAMAVEIGLATTLLNCKSSKVMLKITAVDTEHTRTLVLEGQLIDPWICELERSWSEARMSIRANSIVVDLKDVTTISQQGENMLYRMMADGVEFNCCRGVFTKHVLRQLKQRCKAQSRKA